MRSLLLLCLVVLCGLPSFATQTFVRTIDGDKAPAMLSVVPASDGGWAILSLEAFKIHRFDRCGNPLWSKQFDIPPNTYRPLEFFIATSWNSFVFFTLIEQDAQYNAIMTAVDEDGNILWCNVYADPTLNTVPYTLSEDADGNLVLFANISPNSGQNFNRICKIDPSGQVVWSKKYDHGGTWGGAIVTADGGVLARTGNLFFKTDANGSVQWTTQTLFAQGGSYFPAVEVQDGYIFSNTKGNGGLITFTKLNKAGQLVGNKSLGLDFQGYPPRLRANSQGNLLGIFGRLRPDGSILSVVEFDRNLQTVQHNTLNLAANVNFQGITDDLTFLKDGEILIAGAMSAAPGGIASNIYFAKTDDALTFGCDTIVNFTVFEDTVSQLSLPTNASEAVVHVEPYLVSVQGFPIISQSLCETETPLTVTLAEDTILCPGDSLVLGNLSKDFFDELYWSTGETTQQITITQPGTYWVEAYNNCYSTVASDTVVVGMFDLESPTLSRDTVLCSEAPVVFDASVSNATYLWRDSSSSPIFYAIDPGEYGVYITQEHCTQYYPVHVGECEVLNIPNAFSPNNDGLNDRYFIEYYGRQDYELQLFNRWGQLVFESNDRQLVWDGLLPNGEAAGAGVYYHVLTIGDKAYTGYLHLFR